MPSSDYFCATGLFFVFFLLCDLLLGFFLNAVTEIIKTLILLYILLHIYGIAVVRLEGCTLLLRPQLPLLLLCTVLKLNIDKKTKLISVVVHVLLV